MPIISDESMRGDDNCFLWGQALVMMMFTDDLIKRNVLRITVCSPLIGQLLQSVEC